MSNPPKRINIQVYPGGEVWETTGAFPRGEAFDQEYVLPPPRGLIEFLSGLNTQLYGMQRTVVDCMADGSFTETQRRDLWQQLDEIKSQIRPNHE